MMPFVSSLMLGAGDAAGLIDGTQGSVNAGILAAATVSVSGTTPTLAHQKNVASVTRTGTGKYRVTFTSALANANYGLLCAGRLVDSSDDSTALITPSRNSTGGNNTYSTSTVDILVATSQGAAVDPLRFSIIVFDPSAVGSDYLAACYVTVSGTTPTVQRQTNVGSSPRQGTGLYRPTFTSALPNADYSVFGTSRYPDFTNEATAFFGRNRRTTGTLNQQTTGLLDVTNGQIAHTGGASSFEPASFSLLVRNSDVAPRGTVAAARFSVAGGVCTLIRSWNVSSVTYQAIGCYRLNLTTPIVDSDYDVFGGGKWADHSTISDAPNIGPNRNTSGSRNVQSAGAVDVVCRSYGSGTPVFDAEIVDVWAIKPWLM